MPTMKSTSFAIRLIGLAALLAAVGAQAQGNGPLTDNMGAAAAQASPSAQPAALAQAATSIQSATTPPLQTITLPPQQPVVQATPVQGGITDRPVVRQVSTPMPVPAAPAQGGVQGGGAPQAAPASRPADDDTRDDHGALVRALLAAQADGRRAGPPLPMLGPVATASWDRYLESFKHPIPEWFRERVEAQSSGN
jgi:hypothetical protein